MKKLLILSILLFGLFSCSLQKHLGHNKADNKGEFRGSVVLSLRQKLALLPGVEVEEAYLDTVHFKEAYKLMITQPLDHFDKRKGSFKQKVYLGHVGEYLPMVINLNGYDVPENGFVSELNDFFESNFMHVEHRFFGESIPDTMDYRYLNIEQAAEDIHHIIGLLKNIYKSKWISTGISKGGQTTMFHRRYFPNDVSVSIPYVAPVNLAREDPRLLSFLDSVGTPACRAKILEFQRALLTNRGEALKLFSEKANSNYRVFEMGVEKAFELSILEFEFAYWQWSGGVDCDKIPGDGDSPEILIDYLFAIDAAGFFTADAISFYFPFFYQAYTEIGMYGYSVDSLRGYLTEYKDYVDNYYTFIPEGMSISYDPEPLQEVNRYLKEEANNFIYIYGENDAWSATAFVADTSRTNSITLFVENGSHYSRIIDLNPAQKKIVYDKLEDWLGVEVKL